MLAVKMMFYPLKFVGVGPVGWRGIVPSKATAMAEDIVDNVISRLVDVNDVFRKLPPDEIATCLDSVVLEVGRELAQELSTEAWWGATPVSVLASSGEWLDRTLLAVGRPLIADTVKAVQADAEQVFDLRSRVVEGISADASVLVDLFERCGDQDLRFIVRSGLWLGGLLGLVQLGVWLVWSPWWSLALSGALVGLVTDQLALKIIFEPIRPVRVGPFTLQGLFLQRQAEVSEEFANFMQARVLSSRLLWRELLCGAKSGSFWSLLASCVDARQRRLASESAAARALRSLLGEERWGRLGERVSEKLRQKLPAAVEAAAPLHALTDESLQLQALMSEKMQTLTPAEFERVLHPVFEEDEWTLIATGTALGGLAGAAQAAL